MRFSRNRKPQPPRALLAPRRPDGGSTHVLEAVIIAVVMLSAVAYVATFDTPPNPYSASRENLHQKASDALRILYDTPASGTMGDNMLSLLLMECMQGSCGNLSTRLGNLLPSGASYAIYLSNGQQTFPVLVTRSPSGEAVTATHALEPSWSWNFLSTATDVVDPASEPLLVYSLPIFNSNPVAMGGSPLLVRVYGTRDRDGADYVMTTFASTLAGDADAAPTPAVSLYFTDPDGDPLAYRDVRVDSFARRNATMYLRVNETADVRLAPGLEVAVYLPRGWSGSPNATLNEGVWTTLENATDAGGSHEGSVLRAQLVTELRNGTADFAFDAKYSGDVLEYYSFRAQLSRGAHSSAEVLVRADTRPSTSDYDVPGVFLTAPRPMGRTDTTTWTLSALVSRNPPFARNEETIRLDRIEIVEQNGAPIFGDVQVVSGNYAGSWTSSGDRLTWTPSSSFSLSYSYPLNLAFNVNASGVAGAPAEKGPFTAPVTFDSWTGQLVRQIAPGLFRGEFLPRNETRGGYNGDTGTLFREHGLSSEAVYRSTALRGSSTYSAGTASQVADSLYGSYVSVERRSVPVGGEVAISSNVQSLLFALAQVGQQAGVTLRFYPPWSGDLRQPIFEQQNLDQGLLSGEITQLTVVDMNGDGFPDPVIGTENGRVIALHGLTGLRLQGDVWVAPLRADAEEAGGSARITRLEPIRLGGKDYVVVGTDANSEGIFILNKTLEAVWHYVLEDKAVVSLDTSTDVDGDGRLDVVVGAVTNLGSGSTDDALVYVLRAIEGDATLRPYAPNPTLGYSDAFFIATGTPTALLGLETVGPTGASAGVAVTMQTLVGGGAQIYVDPVDPTKTSLETTPFSTPRAGLAAINAQGVMESTFFGAPVTLARPYDYDGNGVTDVVAGGPAGYVFMMNGSVLTQPLYSYLMIGAATFVDADTRSAVESYALTDDGQVTYTDDGWQTAYYATSAAIPTANAVASPRTNEVWVVGLAGSVWKSEASPLAAVLAQPNYLQGLELVPFVPTATKVNATFNWTTEAGNLTDVWFRGNDGIIVGDRCATCSEPLVATTSDGGATWTVASHLDNSLVGSGGSGAVSTQRLHAVKSYDGVGWIVGDGGLILRHYAGQWRALPSGVTEDLLDVSCDPNAPSRCIAVGENGALVLVLNADGATPIAAPMPVTLTDGSASQRDLLSVGIVDAMRAYIGTENMVLATFDAGLTWTTLPLNYVENDGRAINVNADGTGYVYGGGPGNGRIWFLHDHGTRSTATTRAFNLPAGAQITGVSLVHSNASVGASTVEVEVSTNGADWTSMGLLTPPDMLDLAADSRDYRLSSVEFDPAGGSEFRARMHLTTPGDSTLTSPHVRGLTFRVSYTLAGVPATMDVSPSFATLADVDLANTTASWNTELREVHMPYVREFWTRNVSGEVHDVRTGYDATGDGRNDVWVATGDVLSMSSPDFLIYAGSNESRVMYPDNRVYLLDGLHGGVVRMTDPFDGEVTHLRLSDPDGDLEPDTLFATWWNADEGVGEVVALDPATLDVLWRRSLEGEEPKDLEAGVVEGLQGTAIVGTSASVVDSVAASAGVERTGFVWGLNGTDGDERWRILPEDMGKYHVTKVIPPQWLFGAYVVEIEVEWRDVVTKGEVSEAILRSARFYDYFMVTPPDALTPPSPVYNVHLVTWFQDWS